MRSDPSDSAALFEDAASWQAYESNPYIEERTRIVRSMLPAGAQTFLDVGCGNGILVRALSGERAGIGVDPSLTALRAFEHPRACARGERLPFRKAAVDLVICLEVLEHLTTEGLLACASELSRTTRRWLLVATPEDENPLRNALRCPICGTVFNRSHHMQRFDRDRLVRLFPGFELRLLRRGGQPVRAYRAWLLWLRHHLARRYYRGPGETHGLCPRCGNREFPRFRSNLRSVLLDAMNRILSPRRPYWILLLLERRSGGSIGGDR